MMLKTVLFGGFLFATVCASTSTTETVKPNMATLEVLPNYDQGLTYKDFRVHYSGAGSKFEGSSSVSIKIYKDGEYTNVFHEFNVPSDQVNTPQAYYFGIRTATHGSYEVDVCDGTDCSGKTSALTIIEKNHQTDKITCELGNENDAKQYNKQENVVLNMIEAGDWLQRSNIPELDKLVRFSDPTASTEWTKYNVQLNPSYDESTHVVYASVFFDIGYYRKLFMKKTAPNSNPNLYAPDYCKRKYILSYHVHILEKETLKVVHRFKKTLHMSQGGKKYFIYDNTESEKANRRQVHVELSSVGNLKLDSNKDYQVWVSFCATEKDTNESTVCSDPKVAALSFSNSASA